VRIAGFALACIGVWFVAQPDSAQARPKGLGLAVLSGAGFGAFFVALGQVSAGADTSWPILTARLTSFFIILIAFFLSRQKFSLEASARPLAVGAGVMDTLGNAFYAIAAQAGRLDVAAVAEFGFPARAGADEVIDGFRLRFQGEGDVEKAARREYPGDLLEHVSRVIDMLEDVEHRDRVEVVIVIREPFGGPNPEHNALRISAGRGDGVPACIHSMHLELGALALDRLGHVPTTTADVEHAARPDGRQVIERVPQLQSLYVPGSGENRTGTPALRLIVE